jgi:uncharacterized protein YjiS (DUF1127 family)
MARCHHQSTQSVEGTEAILVDDIISWTPDKPSFVKQAIRTQLSQQQTFLLGGRHGPRLRPMLTNFQVSLHWPAHRRRQGLFSRVRALLQLWRLRIRQRVELKRLGEQGLHDIGQSDADAYRELAKWFSPK